MPPIVYRLMAIMLVQNVVAVLMIVFYEVWLLYFVTWWILAGLFWHQRGTYYRKR